MWKDRWIGPGILYVEKERGIAGLARRRSKPELVVHHIRLKPYIQRPKALERITLMQEAGRPV